MIISAKDFRHDLEKKSVLRRSQQSRLYLDKAHETLETVKRVKVQCKTYLSKNMLSFLIAGYARGGNQDTACECVHRSDRT